MHPLKGLMCCIVGITLCAGASAQIYESKDARGNTVFSDKPSHGAETVDIAPTNSADPIEARPRPAPDSDDGTAPRRSSRSADDDLEEHGYQHDSTPDSTHDHDDYEYYGGSYNNNDADTRSERREQRRNSADRPNPPHVEHRNTGSRPASGTRGR